MENFQEIKNTSRTDNNSIAGKILLGVSGCAAVGLSILCLPFLTPAFRKITLPYIPATDNQLRNILSVLPKNASKNRLLDLGSGDGRIVIECGKVN